MKLLRLDIQTLPGIEPGFSLNGIAPGTNLVTGPNAVGKSSLIRALGYLIGEPRSDDPRALALTAVFDGDSGQRTVRRTGREIIWERDGRTAARPALPERDQLYCYWLSMEELLAADHRDERLVAELRRALSGGYDLQAVRREAPFELRPRAGQSEARKLPEAERALRAVEADYEALRRQEAEIPGLEVRIDAARKARLKAQSLERALALREVVGERKQIEAGLAEFPDNMKRLRGDELQRLEKLESRRDGLRNQIGAQIQARDEARRRLDETGLAEGRPEKAALEVRARDLNSARRKSDQREREQQRLEQAQATERQAHNALGTHEDLPQLDPTSVSEAEALARNLQAAELRHQELEARLLGTGEAPDEADIDRHAQAATALRTWFAAEGSRPRKTWIAILVAGVGGLLTVVTASVAAAWLAVVGGAVALGGAAWALFVIRSGGSASARESFEQTGLEPPEAWQRDAVEARLRDIDGRRAELQQQLARARYAEELQGRLARVKQELETLQQQKAALADKLNFDPALTAAAIDRFVRLVQEYERAHGEFEAAATAIERLDTEVAALTEGISSFLGQWQAAPTDKSLDALEVGLAALRERVEQAETAEREKHEAERERARFQKDLDDVGGDEAALFREAGLEPGQRPELERCIGQFDTWRGQQDRLRDARVREAERRAALEGEDALLQRVEAEEQEELEADFAHAKERAEELESLQEKLTTIRTRLSSAGQDHRLETALTEVDATRMALEEKYRETLLAETAQFLLDGVEQEYRSEHEPEVLRDARERFGRFTHHAFDLELDENEGFFARDLRQQVRRNLPELSSATRMQLLLAMRLAWTRRLEEGRESLPIFLDEALTTSDEQRFRQVADSLERLARDEDRQVFYLSARRHELALWEQATGTRPHHIDLARVRFGQTETSPGDFVLLETESIPAPEGESPENYAAALGVPPVEPRQPDGTLHLFHILRDDLTLLHHLMENWRVSTLGQLEGLLGSSAASAAIVDPNWRRRLQGRCAAARAWIAAWRHGRGTPVDRTALECSDAVSERFLDPVTVLAESLRGDGVALIMALRDGQAPGFRSAKMDELEQWLQAEGYIDPEEPLSSDDRERRTLQDAAGRAEPEDVRMIVRWLEAGVSREQEQVADVVT